MRLGSLRLIAALLLASIPPAPTAEAADPPTASPPASTQPAGGGERDIRPDAPASQPTQPARPAGVQAFALYAARSKDGLEFEPESRPLMRSADSPSLARLPDGRLLLVFERCPQDDRPPGGLGYAISADDGKTWSDPGPLEFERFDKNDGPPRSPAVVVRHRGDVLLYFTCQNRRGGGEVWIAQVASPPSARRQAPERPPEQSRAPADGGSAGGPGPGAGATTKPTEALSCRLVGRVRLAPRPLLVTDITVAWANNEYRLLGTLADRAGRCYHGTSPDGRRFTRLEDLFVAEVEAGGSIVTTSSGLRLYSASPYGVISSVSPDGKTWSREPGMRWAHAEDPAVVQLRDGSWLMVSAIGPPAARSKRRPGRADGPSTTEGRSSLSEQDATTPLANGEAEGAPEAVEGEADESAAAEGDTPQGEDGEAIAQSPPTGDELAALEGITEQGTDSNVPEDAIPFEGFEYSELGVPLPDFVHRVDYLAWMEQWHDPASVPDNAWDSYASFMTDPTKGPLGGSALPLFVGMFSDIGYIGPPAPWNPAEHPEWEEWHPKAAPYIEQYAEAASRRNYVRPLLMKNGNAEGGEAGDGTQPTGDGGFDRLLIHTLLPDLSAHRAMVKQTMSDAWRAPDGKPDPQAMLSAMDTCLSSAEHLKNSDFLIETLVSVAEKALAEKNARFALQQGVFSSPEQLESALEVLVAKDRPLPDPAERVRGELACSLDITQYLFAAGEEGGGRTLRPERFEKILALGSEEDVLKRPTPEELAATTPEQVSRNFVEYYQRYVDMARRGYPEVKGQDLEAMTRPYVENDPVSRVMLPSLSRVHVIATRHEAGRRATQLSYAIHLHKARTGQWPQSLDELPVRYTQGTRIDPFSGRDFVYRPSSDGFVLYSTSENGQDDGGGHHTRWGEENPGEGEGDDFVFWPPS